MMDRISAKSIPNAHRPSPHPHNQWALFA